MTVTSTSTAVATVGPVFTEPERLAQAGFLAGYTGLTREAYALDLRQYASWCQQNHLRLFQACRADVECFARDLETRGRARATITRRLCTIAGFYKYAVGEDLLEYEPRAGGRPRIWLGATASLKERDTGERGQPVHQLVLESRVASLWCGRLPLPVVPIAAAHGCGHVVTDGEPCNSAPNRRACTTARVASSLPLIPLGKPR